MAACPAWLHYRNTVDSQTHTNTLTRPTSINQALAGNDTSVYLSVCVKSWKRA